MAIKMRENKEKTSICSICNTKWKETPIMYDIGFNSDVITLCHDCSQTLFTKLLKMHCDYNAKVKTKEDMQRILVSNERKGR